MSNDKSSIPSSMEDKQPEKATTSANVVNTAQIPTIATFASQTSNPGGSYGNEKQDSGEIKYVLNAHISVHFSQYITD
jgi:hypothetical protein